MSCKGSRWRWSMPTGNRSPRPVSWPSANRPPLQGDIYTPNIGYELVRGTRHGPSSIPTIRTTANSARVHHFAWNPHYTDRHSGQDVRQRQDRTSRRLQPDFRPSERRGSGPGSAARTGPAARRHLRRPANSTAPAVIRASPLPPMRSALGPTDCRPRWRAPSPRCRSPIIPAAPIRNRWTPNPWIRNFRPDRTDNFTFTLQRELNPHMHMEVGYIGKIISNEYQEPISTQFRSMTPSAARLSPARSPSSTAVVLQRRGFRQRHRTAVLRNRSGRDHFRILQRIHQLHRRR